MPSRTWTVRLSALAETDYDQSIRWTARHFGAAQAASYADMPGTALARLGHGPATQGVRSRDDIGPGLCTVHVGSRGRHIILFRRGSEADRVIDVLRILHDAMDLSRHAPSDG